MINKEAFCEDVCRYFWGIIISMIIPYVLYGIVCVLLFIGGVMTFTLMGAVVASALIAILPNPLYVGMFITSIWLISAPIYYFKNIFYKRCYMPVKRNNTNHSKCNFIEKKFDVYIANQKSKEDFERELRLFNYVYNKEERSKFIKKYGLLQKYRDPYTGKNAEYYIFRGMYFEPDGTRFGYKKLKERNLLT